MSARRAPPAPARAGELPLLACSAKPAEQGAQLACCAKRAEADIESELAGALRNVAFDDDDQFDFEKMNGIVGIFGKNYSGMSIYRISSPCVYVSRPWQGARQGTSRSCANV